MLVRLKWLFLCLMAMTSLCGCVANKSYRRSDVYKSELPPSVDPLPASDTDCSHLPAYLCVQTAQGIQPEHFYLAHIEFDDMGELWSIGDLSGLNNAKRSQLENALEVIRKAQAQANQEKRELLVLTFVHGWHNNASPYDEAHQNLGSFKSILQGLSSQELPDVARPPVLVGVFLSWRGQSLAGDFAISYWNRRDAARRVGGPSMTEVVTRLMFETKGVPQPATAEARCEPSPVPGKTLSHFAIIAHSFGARALEHALTQPMLAMILERQTQARECAEQWNNQHPSDEQIRDVSFPAPADLIVFLNAANDAFEAKETIEALKRGQVKVRRRLSGARLNEAVSTSAPFMISITSDGDWATERIMPVAQLVSSTTLWFRRYDKEGCKEEGQLCGHDHQSYFYKHSEASIKEMRSHVVVLQSKPCEHPEWPYFWVESKTGCFCIERNTDSVGLKDDCGINNDAERKMKFGVNAVWNDTPFYVIGVPKTLISDHNDIFQDGTKALLIAISSHYETLYNVKGGATTMTSPVKSKE